MILNPIDNSPVVSHSNLIDCYGFTVTQGGPCGRVGDIIIKSHQKIKVLCDETGTLGEIYYKSLKKQISAFGFKKTYLGSGIINKNLKSHNYSYQYNNREKAFKTNLLNHGTVGVPRSSKCKDKLRIKRVKYYETEEGKNFKTETSLRQKERFSSPENHPMFGKFHTKESNQKNRESQFKYLKENGLTSLGSGHFKTGSFYSKKNTALYNYRSSYELEFMTQLEKSEKVISYVIEPFNVPYTYNSKDRLYFPDFLILTNNKECVVEIKPKRLQEKEINIAKFREASKIFKDNFYILDIKDFKQFIKEL